RVGLPAEGRAKTVQSTYKNYFAIAAVGLLRAHGDDWPDDAWIHWRYRRASLARLLAQEGLMQQVADAYRKVLDKVIPR
ncbi:MAG: hypothetical protein ACLPWG_01950, partial [Steroidobacteraceae bacterium]